MNTQLETKLRRIEKTSVLLRKACTGLLVFAGIVTVFATVALCAGRATSITYSSQSIALAELTLRSRSILVVVGLGTSVVIMKALYHLRTLLDNYSRREIFTVESARQVRQFGITCMLWGAVKIGWSFLPTILQTHPHGPVAISADSLVIGAVIVGLSWFAEMATTLREENDLTI